MRGNENYSKPWKTGPGIVAQCSSNEQLCLSDLMYGPSRTVSGKPFPMHRHLLLGSGRWWNRGRSPLNPDVPPPDARLHVMHYMGGGRGQADLDLCGNKMFPAAVGDSARKVLGVCGAGDPNGGRRAGRNACGNMDRLSLEDTDVFPLGSPEPKDPWKQLPEMLPPTTAAVETSATDPSTSTAPAPATTDDNPSSTSASPVPSTTASRGTDGASSSTFAPAAETPDVEEAKITPLTAELAKEAALEAAGKEKAASASYVLSYSCCDRQDWMCCGEDI